MKCLLNDHTVPEPLLLQCIRNSLRGTPRSMLISLGEKASVSEVLDKLTGFYGTVSSSEILLQSFFSDSQKDNESIVTYGSRLEQTITKAIRSGHIDGVAKDAMLRSKFWTGLKSQSLKNSTRHLYDSVKDFKSLIIEIRKVEQEDSSSKPSKKQAAQQQHTGQVIGAQASDSSTTEVLLQKMTDMMGQMQKLMDQQSSIQAELSQSSSAYDPDQSYYYRGRGRGNRGSSYDQEQSYYYQGRGRGNRGSGNRGGYGRGYFYQNQKDSDGQRVAVNLTIPIEENGEEVISAATAMAPTAVVLTGVAMLATPRTL